MKRFLSIVGLLFCVLFSYAENGEVKISHKYLNFFINEKIVIYQEERSLSDNCKWHIQIENKSKDAIEIIDKDDMKQKEKDIFKIKFNKTGDVEFRLVYAGISNPKDIKEIINYHVTVKKIVDEIMWYTDFEVAKAIAKHSDKHILLLFTGSDWSNTCKNLERDVFQTEEFKQYAKNNLVLCKMDLLKKKSPDKEMLKQIDRLRLIYDQRTFPSSYILNYDGEKIGIIKGAAENYMERLIAINRK